MSNVITLEQAAQYLNTHGLSLDIRWQRDAARWEVDWARHEATYSAWDRDLMTALRRVIGASLASVENPA